MKSRHLKVLLYPEVIVKIRQKNEIPRTKMDQLSRIETYSFFFGTITKKTLNSTSYGKKSTLFLNGLTGSKSKEAKTSFIDMEALH